MRCLHFVSKLSNQRVGGFVNDVGRINGNLNLSRSLGDLKYKQIINARPQDQMITAFPDVTITEMTNDDEFMILACDGVWDIMTCQSACDFVREKISKGKIILLSPLQFLIYNDFVYLYFL
jgi:serine/threonine protein phosphatase PrpC